MADTMMSDDDRRGRVVALATQAEAALEALEARSPRGRWALTAFSRYRMCEVLGIAPYGTFVGDLTADPVELLEEAATEADRLGVPLEDVSWRLAVADALRSAVVDVQMVRNVGEVTRGCENHAKRCEVTHSYDQIEMTEGGRSIGCEVSGDPCWPGLDEAARQRGS